MLTKSSEKNRGRWEMGIVTDLYYEKDNVLQPVRLRAGKDYLDLPIQYLYPLELTCDGRTTSKLRNEKTLDTELNANNFKFKAKRNAAAIVRLKMQDKNENDFSNTD